MSYAQDTIVSANAADAFAGVLDGLLLDAGWTVVEALSPGASTWRTKVYKSDGGDNTAGYDWYLAVKWNTLGTEQQVEVIAGAAYDTGTHSLGQVVSSTMVPNNGVESSTGAYMGPVNVNTQTNTTFTTTNHGQVIQKPWFASIVPSSAFGYWMSVTLDHVAIYTTIPGWFHAATLAVDPAWAAQPFDTSVNPIIGAAGNGIAPPNNYFGDGISANMIVNGVAGFQPIAFRTHPIGSKLPIISGNYLPSYAWRAAYYLKAATGSAGTGTPPWDSPTFGDGFHIGDIIDFYYVYGGSIGDTVEIDGATYVLSGQVPTSDGDNPTYIAVLVE
jgi:hypothetical protein